MVGLSCLDHIWQIEHFPPQQSRTQATAYRCQGGGPAATAAVTAACLGASTTLWAIHGDDANGELTRQELEAFGVNTSSIRVVKNSQTVVSSILVQANGERHIFPYKDKSLIDSADHLDLEQVTSFACIMTDSRHPIMNEAILKKAKQQNIPIVADFGNLDNWHLAPYASHLIASEECASKLLGRNNPEAALELLKQAEQQFVGITLGEEGFLYDYKGDLRHIPAFPVDVVDSTGAGDVFHGAFAYALTQNWDIHYCGLFASVTAALSCTALGGRAGIPASQEVQHLLEEQTRQEMDEAKWNWLVLVLVTKNQDHLKLPQTKRCGFPYSSTKQKPLD